VCCASAEEKPQMRNAFAGVPENYRVPLVLRFYSELSYDEIARQRAKELCGGVAISNEA